MASVATAHQTSDWSTLSKLPIRLVTGLLYQSYQNILMVWNRKNCTFTNT